MASGLSKACQDLRTTSPMTGQILWGLCIATFVISVAATRPTAFIAHIIVVVLAVLLTVLAVPNRFTNQLTMSLVYIIGETLILAHSLWTSPPTYTTALFLLFLANSIAVASESDASFLSQKGISSSRA